MKLTTETDNGLMMNAETASQADIQYLLEGGEGAPLYKQYRYVPSTPKGTFFELSEYSVGIDF